MDSFEDKARRLYKSKQWAEAAEIYTKLIKLARSSPNLQHLDRRAMCYEGLGKLTDALEDARSMILFEKSNIRGYLRVGKVYQLMKKDESALRYYERALKATSESDPLRNIVIDMKTAVEERIRRKHKEMDLFCVLPIELVWRIFGFCNIADCARASRVSRLWRRTITRTPFFWQDMDFTGLTKQPGSKTLETYLLRSRRSLRSLRIRASIGRSIQQQALGPKLTHLECFWPMDAIPGLRMMKTLEVLKIVEASDTSKRCPTFSQVAELIRALPNLQSMSADITSSTSDELQLFSQMKSSTLLALHITSKNNNQEIEAEALNSATQPQSFMPRLQSLRLVGCAVFVTKPGIFTWPPSLRLLETPSNICFRTGREENQEVLPANLKTYAWRMPARMLTTSEGSFPPLETLICHRDTCRNRDQDSHDPCWPEIGKTLTSLRVTGTWREASDLCHIMSYCTKLQNVTFQVFGVLDDSVLESLSKATVALKTLDLGYRHQFGALSILNLVQSQPGLHALGVPKDSVAPDILQCLRLQRGIRITEHS